MRLMIPNNPVRVSVDLLKELAEEDRARFAKNPSAKPSRIAEDKWDGWRRIAYKFLNEEEAEKALHESLGCSSGRYVFQSKHGDEAKIAMPDDLLDEFKELFQDFDTFAVDMEWVGPRNKDALAETYGEKDYHGLRLFNLTWLNGQYLGARSNEYERYQSLKTIYELCRAKRPHAARRIEVVRCWEHDWDEMFEENKSNPCLEGIVLKRADSFLVNKDKNPKWFKVKYRDIKEPCKF